MPGFFLAYVLRHMLLLHPLVLQIRLLRVVLLFLWLTLGIPAVRAFHITPCVVPHATTNMPRCCHPIADEFKPSYASVLVYGPDAPAKLAKFRDKEGLSITLLSDADRAVMNAYGAFGEKKLYGKTVTGVIRSTIVVGPTALVEVAQYNVKATGHVAKLLRDLQLT